MEVQKIRQVTLPVLKIGTGVERYFKLTSAMRTGKQVSDQMGPAEIIDATDLETGEIGVIIASKVLQNELHSNYPKDTYVGLCFAILQTRVPEKRYNMVTLAQIKEPKAPSAEEAQAIMAKRAVGKRAALADPLKEGEDEGEEGDPENEHGAETDAAPARKTPAKKAPAKKAAARRR